MKLFLAVVKCKEDCPNIKSIRCFDFIKKKKKNPMISDNGSFLRIKTN